MASQVRRTLHRRGVSWRKPGVAAAAVAAGVLVLSGCANPEENPSPMTETPPPPPVWTGAPEPATLHEEDEHEDEAGAASRTLETQLSLADGTEIGTVTITEYDDYLRIRTVIDADSDDVPPGFKGFHIHAVGECEPDGEAGDFSSAGGHLHGADADHGSPGAAGDLVSVDILENGRAELVTLTDRVTIDDLLDDDGTAIILHTGPDNFGNIPDRYGDGPDEETLSTGDSGQRLACGVLEEH